MAYLVDENPTPSNFVTEDIPEAFKASFDPRRLYTPLGLGRWPDDQWTVDHIRNVALVTGGTNGNAASDAGVPTNYWMTLLVQGQPVGMVFNDDSILIPGRDARTGREYELLKLRNTHLYFPRELYGRKEEISRLIEEAYYVLNGGRRLEWVRGVEIEVAESHLDIDYRNSRHVL